MNVQNVSMRASLFIITVILTLLFVVQSVTRVDALSTYVWDDRNNIGVVPLENGPTDYGNPYLWMVEGTRFRMTCFKDFKGITGNYYSVRWFYGQEYSRGSWGYVHSSYVKSQTYVGRC